MRKDTGELLSDLKRKIERVKSDIAAKEGEKKAIFSQLKREFGVEDLDDAYGKLDKLTKEIESKEERKEKLLQEAREALARYE